MIGYLKGKIIQADEKSAIIETAGVGYEVLMSLSTLLKLKIENILEIYVHTHVREDQITLFGFESIEEKEMFRKLISVSGIGPKSALTMLSVASVSTIVRAIESGSVDNFPKVPGVGKKTLEKLILELRGKFDNIVLSDESADMKNAKLALETLGYNPREISTTLSTLHPELDMSSLIKEGLRLLSNS